MKTETDDSIYLEPGSVWRRGDEWRKVDEHTKNYVCFREFSQRSLSCIKRDWLDWTKHPDTVLVYSPSGNKLPPKPGYVRVKIPVIVDQDGHAWHNPGGGDHYSIVDVFGVLGGCALAAFVLGLYFGLCAGVGYSDNELIKRGYKTYHPTTGKLIWKDEVTE